MDTLFFSPSTNGYEPNYHLIVSALVPYKRLDVAIDAFNQLGLPLIIVGTGPDLEILRQRAAPNIRFRGWVGDEELRELYRNCRALIVPGREDFCMASLEAQACGCPVVAYAQGGVLESVVDGKTGVLFERQAAADLAQAVRRMATIRFNLADLRSNAERFSKENFRQSILQAIESAVSRKVASAARTRPSAAVKRAGEQPHASVQGAAGLAKRLLDVALSLIGLALAGPVLLLATAVIRLESHGPALFFQRRVGLAGRPFSMAKLRTMVHQAERETGPVWAVNDDPRCTPFGGILRRYGLDELPQLWNVLKGDMSLVGPRPERPEFHEAFACRNPNYKRRVEVRGGLTGLAQIRGWRGDTSLAKRLESDLEYIERWSLWNDLRILIRTPLSLMRPRGKASR